jgi:tRNA (mo5U34)-methyltransferase
VLYHLRHPLLALDLIRQHVAKDLLLFQSMQRGCNEVADVAADYDFWETAIFEQPEFPQMFFIEKNYAHDPTNWWIPNRACVEAMLRSAGFAIVAHPEEEVFLCQVGALPIANCQVPIEKQIAATRTASSPIGN